MSDPKHLFVLEDSEVDIAIFKAHMKHFDVSICCETSISKAKAQFDINQYDAAILDWNLPDGKGIEIAQYINPNYG